jgi:hypothetical protein
MASGQNGKHPYAEGGLERWHEGVRISQIGHVRAATRDGRLGRALGVMVTALAAAVGTTQFVTISETPSTTLKVIAGSVAFTATVAAAINTFMAYDKLADRHSNGSHLYGALRREMEEWHMGAQQNEAPPPSLLHKWEEQWNKAEATSPPIPDRTYKKVAKEVKSTGGGTFIPTAV